MALAHHHSHSGSGYPTGDVFCLDGKVGHPAKDVRIIVGGGAVDADDMIGRLLARWLSEKFGYAYAENRTCTEGILAIEAFYDRFHDHFGPSRKFLGILAILPGRPPTSPRNRSLSSSAERKSDRLVTESPTGVQAPAGEFRCLTELTSLELKFQGMARAHPSLSAQKVQVILEDLPGAIEFVGSGKLRETARLRLAESMLRTPSSSDQQAGAWYGFGVPIGREADIIATIGRKVDARPARVLRRH